MPITLPGTGEIVATDEVGSDHYELVKLAAGTTGSAEPIGATDLGSYDALWVDHRLNGATQSQASAGLTTASTNYTAGDVLGSGWTFTSMARAAGLGGRIKGIHILDKGDVMTSCELYISSTAITFGTDNAAPSVSDADAQTLKRIPGFGFQDLGGCRLASLDSLDIMYFCAATSLFVYAMTTVANNFFAAVTDLYLTLDYVPS